MATALVLKLWLLAHVPLAAAAALGLVLALLGVVGDLFESLLKRSVEIKDTASLLPGHGGILDRLDSLFFAAPALYLYVVTFL
jgi:phosphatidate cytidylyltransferase